jgi:hypothetical protein
MWTADQHEIVDHFMGVCRELISRTIKRNFADEIVARKLIWSVRSVVPAETPHIAIFSIHISQTMTASRQIFEFNMQATRQRLGANPPEWMVRDAADRMRSILVGFVCAFIDEAFETEDRLQYLKGDGK